jgi:hypothetical protein
MRASLEEANRPHTVGAQSTVDVALQPQPENPIAGPNGQQAQDEACLAATTAENENQRLRSKVVEHALFVLSNLATGDETVISEVMDCGVPALLPNYLAYISGDSKSYGAVRSPGACIALSLISSSR